MQELKDLVHSLSPTEYKSIRNLFVIKGEQKYQKRLQLFDLIFQNPQIDSNKASKLIYGKMPTSAFSQLKRRLREDLMEMLIICGETDYDPYQKSEQECARMLLQSCQLIHRGLRDQASKLLNRMQSVAKKYEFREYCNLAAQYKAYSKETTENILTKWKGEKLCDIDPKAVLENPERQLLHSKSKRRDLLLILQLLEDQLTSETADTFIPVIRRILKVMKQVPALSKPMYFKACYQLMGKALMLRGEYQNALEYLEPACHFTEVNMCHRLLEILLIVRLKLGEYDKASKLLMKWETDDKSSKTLPKRKYYKACMHFEYQDYKSVIRELNVCQKKNKMPDNSMGFWSRILELMALTEMGEYDWAEYRLEALRKFFFNHELNRCKHFNTAFIIFRAIFSMPDQKFNPKKTKFHTSLNINLSEYKPSIFEFEVFDWLKWTQSRMDANLC